ncbi:MAG: hypothetical protein ACFFAU_00345 [Candidatus Hodarchaeota archaeon]
MMHEILQDPDWISYENLFFFLSLGKYDTTFLVSESNFHIEEFLILGEPWKDQIEYLENVIGILTQQFIRESEFNYLIKINSSIEFKIFVILYKTPNTGRLIGIGIRIVTNNSNISSMFAPCSEERLQKAMYLVSRGLLKSPYHMITQIFRTLPL